MSEQPRGSFCRRTRREFLWQAGGGFTALPLIAFVAGAQRLPLVTLGFLIYINPTCQLLLALFWFGESLDSAQAWCFGLVWVGLALYVSHGLRSQRDSGNGQSTADRRNT